MIQVAEKSLSDKCVMDQSLSHQLHSSRLQYLGLAAALRGFCQEFSQQQKVEGQGLDPLDLPPIFYPEISLCFSPRAAEDSP